jgi:hypothetical protein
VVHSLDRVHRLVRLERLGQSNSSLGTDLVVPQAGGNRRSSKWWCMQRGAEDNGTPCQHTNTLHAAQGDGRTAAKVVHVVVAQAGGKRRRVVVSRAGGAGEGR